jgi:hypothetical protein
VRGFLTEEGDAVCWVLEATNGEHTHIAISHETLAVMQGVSEQLVVRAAASLADTGEVK